MANSELPRHRTHTPVASAVPTAVIALSVAGMLAAPIGTASAATGENFAGILENLATEQTGSEETVVDVQDGILTVGDIAFTLPSGLEGAPVDGTADIWSFEGTDCSFTVKGLQLSEEDSFELWDLAHSQTGDGFGNWLMGGYPESVYLDYVRYDTGTLSFNLVFLMDTAGDKVAGFMLVPNDTLRTFTEVVFTFPAETFESSLTLVDAMCQGAEPAGSAATVLRASDAISALKESRQPAVEEAKAATDEEEAATDEADEAEADKADEKDADADEATNAEATEAAAGSYADDTYEGTGKGIGGDVPVTVTVEGGKIASVEVGDNSETQGIGSNAIEQLPELIVEAGGTEGVDGVSGATITSNAIFAAVEEALEQARS